MFGRHPPRSSHPAGMVAPAWTNSLPSTPSWSAFAGIGCDRARTLRAPARSCRSCGTGSFAWWVTVQHGACMCTATGSLHAA